MIPNQLLRLDATSPYHYTTKDDYVILGKSLYLTPFPCGNRRF